MEAVRFSKTRIHGVTSNKIIRFKAQELTPRLNGNLINLDGFVLCWSEICPLSILIAACLTLKMEAVLPIRFQIPTRLHGVIFQCIILFIVIVVKTSESSTKRWLFLTTKVWTILWFKYKYHCISKMCRLLYQKWVKYRYSCQDISEASCHKILV
jgi:hypothetical protein